MDQPQPDFPPMCRHAAYVGPLLGLNDFLLQPSHSLVEQSFRPKEMLTATVNVDGFGVGWYLDDGRAGIYTNPMPIWSDSNLEHLAVALDSRIWVANVRSATTGQPINQANTHPFLSDRFLFSHNGFIKSFFDGPRSYLREIIKQEYESEIRGSTDSEHLFAWFRQELADSGTAVDAFRRVFDRLESLLVDSHGLFNLLVADGERVYATRHAINHDAPSLYVGTDPDLYQGGWIVASESFTAAPEWQEVPDHHLVVLEADKEPKVTPL